MQTEGYGGAGQESSASADDGQSTTAAGAAPCEAIPDAQARAVAKRARRGAERLAVVRAEVARTFSRVETQAAGPVQHVEALKPDLKRSASRLHNATGTARHGECVFALIALEGGYIGSMAEGCGRPRCPVCVVEKRATRKMLAEADKPRGVSRLKATTTAPPVSPPGLPPNSNPGAEAPCGAETVPSEPEDAADDPKPNPPNPLPPPGVGGRAGRGRGARSEGVQGGNPPASLDTPSRQRRNTLKTDTSKPVVSSAGGARKPSEGVLDAGPTVSPKASAKPGLRPRGRRGWYVLRPRRWKFRAWRRAIASRVEGLVQPLPDVSRLKKSMQRRAKAMRACGARVLVRECDGCGGARLGSGIPDDGSGRAVDELGKPLRGPRPCGARSCSFCERRAAAKRASALMAAMKQVPPVKGYRWRFVTITVPYDPMDPEAVTVEALARRREVAFAILAEAWLHGQAMHKHRWEALEYEEQFAWLAGENEDPHHRAWWRRQSEAIQQSWLKLWGIDPVRWAGWSRQQRLEVIKHERHTGVLKAMRAKKWAAARRFMRPQFRLGVEGAAMFSRVELGGRGGGHVHAHALVYSPFISVEWLRAISERMGGGFVWVEDADVSTAREVAKYTVKSCSPLDEGWLAGEQRLCLNPELVARWEIATFGVRMSRVRGELVGKMDCKEPDPQDEDTAVDETVLHGAERDADLPCSFCGKVGAWRWVVRNMGEWIQEAHERGGPGLWGSRWGHCVGGWGDDPEDPGDDEELERHRRATIREGPAFAPEP